MTAKKGRKRSKGEQRSIATAEKHRQQDQRWSYYQRRKANGGRPLRANGHTTPVEPDNGKKARVESDGRASFGEEMKAYADIKTILERLPHASQGTVFRYLSMDDSLT